jgi:hypothetical protein
VYNGSGPEGGKLVAMLGAGNHVSAAYELIGRVGFWVWVGVFVMLCDKSRWKGKRGAWGFLCWAVVLPATSLSLSHGSCPLPPFSLSSRCFPLTSQGFLGVKDVLYCLFECNNVAAFKPHPLQAKWHKYADYVLVRVHGR